MDLSTIKYEVADGIGILTFNRPHAMNAHNYQMKVEVQAAVDEAAHDDAVRVLIVTGEGRGFHAGEDVKDVFMGGDVAKLKADRIRNLVGTKNSGDWTGQVSPRYFLDFPKPTVAAVNGPAVGAGLSIAISCDVRIASERAGFGFFYTRRGLMGPTRGLTMLIHLIGYSRTAEMALSGELVDADEALRCGLVREVVPTDQLMERAGAMARKLMQGAPLAQRAIKACMYKTLYDPGDLEPFGDRVEAALIETEDHHEGARAFREKRPPVWTGR